MNLPPSLRAYLASALLLGTVAGILACHDAPATAPSRRNSAPPLTSTSSTEKATRALRCTQSETVTNSAVIGREGGTLEVGGHRLIVPAGALNKPTLITGTVPGDTTATILFEPSGLKFKVRATLVLSVKQCESPGDKDKPAVMYIDDVGRPLDELPTHFDRTRKEVTSPIDHFSGYQVWV